MVIPVLRLKPSLTGGVSDGWSPKRPWLETSSSDAALSIGMVGLNYLFADVLTIRFHPIMVTRRAQWRRAILTQSG